MATPLDQLLEQSRGSLPVDLPPSSIPPRAIDTTRGVSGDALVIGSSGVPAWGKVTVAASAVSGILPASGGGTGQGIYAAGDILYADTVTSLARRVVGAQDTFLAINSSLLPAYRRITAADVDAGTFPGATYVMQSLTLSVTPLNAESGGTEQAVVALGDVLYGSATDAWSRLAGNITVTRKFLRQVGTGAVSAAPAWDTLTAADVLAGSFPTGGHTFLGTLIVAGLLTAQAGLTVSGASLTVTSQTIQVTDGPSGFYYRMTDTGVGGGDFVFGAAIGGLNKWGVWDNVGAANLIVLSKAGGSSFFSGNINRWNIPGTGHLLAAADNTYDIGASGATRPRDLYIAGAGTFGGDVTIAGDILRGATNSNLDISGGSTGALGARISLWGESHATNALDIAFYSSGSLRLFWDNSVGSWSFQSLPVSMGALTATTGAFSGLLTASDSFTVSAGVITAIGLNKTASADAALVDFDGTITNDADGTINALLRLRQIALTDNSVGTIEGATLYIDNAPTTTGAGSMWALNVVAGSSRFGGRIESIYNGGAPFTVVNATVVTNLNADLLDGDHSSAFPRLGVANTWTVLQTFNTGTTPAQNIFLDIDALVSAGQRDSHWIRWRGRGFSAGFPRETNWYAYIDVTSDAGASQWTLGYATSGVGPGTAKFAVTDIPAILLSGTQVIKTRITGYTNAMTGTADRATGYDTSTITLPQLAERVKAIQDDITTHGLIGV